MRGRRRENDRIRVPKIRSEIRIRIGSTSTASASTNVSVNAHASVNESANVSVNASGSLSATVSEIIETMAMIMTKMMGGPVVTGRITVTMLNHTMNWIMEEIIIVTESITARAILIKMTLNSSVPMMKDGQLYGVKVEIATVEPQLSLFSCISKLWDSKCF